MSRASSLPALRSRSLADASDLPRLRYCSGSHASGSCSSVSARCLLLAFGLWLVHLEHLSYRAGWISTSIALYIVALGLGAAGGRRPKQARHLATELAAENAAASPRLRWLLNDPWSLVANYGSGTLVLAILVLMVFKP